MTELCLSIGLLPELDVACRLDQMARSFRAGCFAIELCFDGLSNLIDRPAGVFPPEGAESALPGTTG